MVKYFVGINEGENLPTVDTSTTGKEMEMVFDQDARTFDQEAGIRMMEKIKNRLHEIKWPPQE